MHQYPQHQIVQMRQQRNEQNNQNNQNNQDNQDNQDNAPFGCKYLKRRDFKKFLIYTPDDNQHEYELNVVTIVLLFVTSIIITATVAKSFHYINYNEYALKQNKYGSVSLAPTYDSGRYFLTLNYDLITFPSTYQPVNFQSTVFAENGMEFILYITFYYKLPKDSLGNIYNIYSLNYGQRIENNAKNIIKNIAPKYSIQDYLSNRMIIEQDFATNISTNIFNVVGVVVPLNYVRITNIIFPDILISTSLDSALALQKNQLNLIKQSVQLISAQTDQMVANITAQTQLLLQNTNNTATQITNIAQTEGDKIINVARSSGLAYLFDTLNITSNTDKIALINAMAIYDNVNSTIFNKVFPNTQITVG